MAGKKKPEQVTVVKFGDRTFDLRDLPVGKVHEIARDFGVSWVQVVAGPLAEVGVAEAVVRAAAEQVGPTAEVPEPLTVRVLDRMFTQVDDDLPESESTSTDPPTGAET